MPKKINLEDLTPAEIEALEKLHERTSPEDPGHRVLLTEHLAAYRFARQQMKEGQKILDLGCGKGYGSEYLAQKAELVIGADYSKPALIYASEHYLRENITFLQFKAPNLPFQEKSLDWVVCHQLIEHLDPDQQECLVKGIFNILKDTGGLSVTTPNRITFAVHVPEGNPFHKREFEVFELEIFLKRYFRQVKIHGISGTERYKAGLEKLKKGIIPELGEVTFEDYELISDFENCMDLWAICYK